MPLPNPTSPDEYDKRLEAAIRALRQGRFMDQPVQPVNPVPGARTADISEQGDPEMLRRLQEHRARMLRKGVSA